VSRVLSLSPTAKVRLREISEWTKQNFGPRQAILYGAELIAVAEQVADGTLRGRNCAKVWGAGIPSDLFFVPSRSHLIFFTETSSDIVVTDILHKAMDVPGRLSG
jgi:plasmid stabilization system protein ParE